MRPERLELEGFTAFRERTEVDFEGADLFALTGATGAGKSSLIDAMCFALYGVVPRYDDRRLVAPVISQGAAEARVRLDFAVGPERFTAVRVVRATATGATTREARLERRLADGVEVLAGTADELTAEVTARLGLTFEHFTTCVVLPQGDFAQFLHAKPRDRQKLLVELLDLGLYERMRTLAKAREAAAQAGRAALSMQLDDARELADPSRIAELERRTAALSALVAQVDAEHERRTELERRATAATQAAEAAAHKRTVLASLSAPDGVGDLAGSVSRAADALVAARRAEDDVATAVEDAEKALAALLPRAEIERVRGLAGQVATYRQRRTKGQTLLRESRDGRDAAAAALAAAEARHRQARAALDEAQRRSLVATITAGLATGDPCPVCGHELGERHDDADAEALAAASADLEAAARDEVDRRRSLAEAATLLTKVETTLATVDAEVERLEGELVDAPDEVALALADRQLTEAEAALGARRSAARAARTRRNEAEAAEQAARRAEADGRARFDAARDAVASLGPPTPERTDLAADWRALTSWADGLGPELEADEQRERAAAAEAIALVDALVGEIVAECRALGVSITDGAVVRDLLVDARAEVETELARRRGAARSITELVERDRALAEAGDLAAALARHLSANGFEKWVLEAALRHLVGRATEVLLALSGGAYSLDLEPRTSNFCVIDHHNADARRSARTLSGGETFLASLALALSLADEVAQLAAGSTARLESMFLDEGFGTLDADTLDTVATALEDLGAQGRSIGLVTHVAELAERLPTRFVVTKGPSGSSVERVDR
jgi:exonuclease SbcC